MSLKIDSVSLYLQIKLLHHLRAATHKDGFSFWSEMTDHVAAGNEGGNHNDYDRGQGCVLNANRQAVQFMQNSGKTF